MSPRHTERLVIADGIGWVRKADGTLKSAIPSQYVAEVKRLRGTLEAIALFGANNPGFGYSCARMAREALSDDQKS